MNLKDKEPVFVILQQYSTKQNMFNKQKQH